MKVETLNQIYEAGYFPVVVASLISAESNTDITEAQKNLDYLNEMNLIKGNSKLPKEMWHFIEDGIKICQAEVERFKKQK